MAEKTSKTTMILSRITYEKEPDTIKPAKAGFIVCMVRQKGFEPLTARFVAEYSIQLSYWRIRWAIVLALH